MYFKKYLFIFLFALFPTSLLYADQCPRGDQFKTGQLGSDNICYAQSSNGYLWVIPYCSLTKGLKNMGAYSPDALQYPNYYLAQTLICAYSYYGGLGRYYAHAATSIPFIAKKPQWILTNAAICGDPLDENPGHATETCSFFLDKS